MSRVLKVLTCGTGFMGRTHAEALKIANHWLTKSGVVFELDTVWDLTQQLAEPSAQQWGYRRWSTELGKAIEEADIVDICVPNAHHAAIALEAARAGKIIWCEKPLADTMSNANRMCEAARQANSGKGVPTMVHFCYRFAPAIQLWRKFMEEGRIRAVRGERMECISRFLQDWGMDPATPQGGGACWRFDAKTAGAGGVIDDLGQHAIDLLRFLLDEEVVKVMASTEIVIAERPHAEHGNQVEPITAVDTFAAVCRFESGSRAIVESTRFSRGRKAFFETALHGKNGAAQWELENHPWLKFFEYQVPGADKPALAEARAWRDIHVSNFEHPPFTGHPYVPGLTHGYGLFFAAEMAEFGRWYAEGMTGKPMFATFEDARKTAKVADAILRAGKAEDQWVPIAP